MAYIRRKEEIKEYQGRYGYVKVCVFVTFMFLLVRIWYLQILNGEKFYVYSKANSLKQEKIPAPRGMMLDRNRETVTDSYPSFDITWTPQYITQTDQTMRLLRDLLGISTEEIQEALRKERTEPGFKPRVIRKDVSRDEVAQIEIHRFDMPGIDVAVEIKRMYREGSIGAHLLGYIGEINARELDVLNRRSFQKYRQGDFVGKFGIEGRWEDYLRGMDGARYSEVDAFGRKKSQGVTLFDYEQTKKEPVPGKNLVLTIDRHLQRAAAQALRDKKTGNPKAGALVALDPHSGEILAMISQPGFDPTDFSRGVETPLWNALIAHEQKPMLDKALQDSYPPGSTFKPVTALAGLASGAIDPEETVNCDGHYFLGRARFRCWTWRKGGHGRVNLRRAIKESCDYYFYRAGVKTGVDTLGLYAKMYGMGSKTGLNLLGEVSGTVPSQAWKLERFKERWYPGETPSVAIGQGYLTITVLQMARLYAAIANGGTLYVPYAVKRIEESNGVLVKGFDPQMVKTAKIDDKIWKHLKEGLYAVVNEPGGTAYWSGRVDGLDIAGKTGTSQVVRLSKADEPKECEQLPWKYRDHAWFVGFAPVDDPQIVVAALGLHDCHPYHGAAQAVRDVLKTYLADRIDPKKIRHKKKIPVTRKAGADA